MTDVPPSPERLSPGDLVGPWRVENYAGRGSYGVVFRARLAAEPRSPPVALKVGVFPGDPRFVREATLLSKVCHPSVPRMLDQGSWHSSGGTVHPYIVMEWVLGLPLYEWARYHPVSPRQSLLVVAQVADALALLHQTEGLHRDVKGDNILVDSEGRAVLTDFGSGTWRGAPPLTETFMPPNTPEYRSPEALRFQWRNWNIADTRYEATAADDLYALGVTAYKLVTRVYPPPGTSPEELKQRLRTPPARRPPALALNSCVGPELSGLIEGMLAEGAERRSSASLVAERGMAHARQLGSRADVPLFTVDRPRAAVPCEFTPVLPAPSVKQPVSVVPMAQPARARGERSKRFLAVSSTFVSILVVLTVRGILPPSQTPATEPLTMIQEEEARDGGAAPDGGTRALGEDALASRVEPQPLPLLAKVVSQGQLKHPIPGQQRPPCQRSGAKIIQGGCWLLLADTEPPCGDDEYEWQGACYKPVMEGTRPPTSDKPQQ